MRLSDLNVRALPAPAKGQKTYFDDTLAGFGCRVSQAGTRSFVVMHGRSRQLTTIGKFGIIGLSDARKRAREILAEQVLGKTRAPTHMPFGGVVEQFLFHHHGRPKTLKEYRRLIYKHFMPKLRLEPIERIKTSDLTKIVDKLLPTPSIARHAFAVIMNVMNWAVSRRYITHNPLEGVQPPKLNPSRERVLTDEELVKVWTAADPNTAYGCIIRLCLLLGQRRSATASIQPEWLKAGVLTFPAASTKGKRVHAIPITEQAETYIASSPFTCNNWSKSKVALDEKCGVTGWTVHDCRRSFASRLQRLGVRIEVTEKFLGHVSGKVSGITGIYQRHDYMEEMRTAAELWETHLASLLQKEHDSAA